MWFLKKTSKKPKSKKQDLNYQTYKEKARKLVWERLLFWNRFYNFKVNQVRIKNTVSRWGSCSSLGNLNFHYKILFLPKHLQDYLIVHELCHLKEMNHSRKFWTLVEKTIPNYQANAHQLKSINLTTFNKNVIIKNI